MRLLIGLAVLGPMIAPMTAYAGDGAQPEELFLGDHAWLQDRAELQLTAMPAWQRERWEVAAAAEYGLTSRVQLSLEGAWTDGPRMDVLRELELGARFAALRSGRWAVAVGANATAEIADGNVDLGVEPQASLSFATRSVGANLAVSGALASDIEPAIAVALFARVGPVIPLLEAGIRDGDIVTRGGLAVQVGSAQLIAALGYSAEIGASVHAALTWEIAFGDDDDHEEAP